MVEDFVSVSEASAQLGVDVSRVRALLAAGQLVGDKLGGRWLVSQESVQERLRLPHDRGRQLRPGNAWSALLFASGEDSQLGERRDRARVLRLLEDRGIVELAPRLRDRAVVRRFYGHPGVLSRLAMADALRRSGVSAAPAYSLGLVPGDELDAYVAADGVDAIVSEFGLASRDGGANVVLRVLPVGVVLPSKDVAPFAAVAVDLAEQAEPRAARIGRVALQGLGRERRWRSVAPEALSAPRDPSAR